ncbi:MAG: tetratricopeptide repeat protein [Rhizobacter sp.]|nr:tetratricopeptide repeat protein [Burkholderiales bacterium]
MESPVANIEAQLAIVIGLVNSGQSARAMQLCQSLEISHPPHPAVLQLLAVLELQAGAPADARRHVAASLSLRPDHIPTLMLASEVARATGDLPLAARTLQRVVRLAPEHVSAWFQLALVQQDLQQLEAAVASLRSLLRLAPERVDAEVNLGIVLQERGQMDEAMRAYGRAYRLRADTFGRIAHALATPRVGRLWLDLNELKVALQTAPA